MKTEDIKKIYYFLLSTNPINKKNLKHQLKFPYKIREFLWIWNVLNEILSKPTKDYNDKNHDEKLLRGKYLVTAAGHCGACHSPRTWFSIVKNYHDLSGRKESFKNAKDGASNITSMKKAGIGLWSKSDIIFYLQTGIKPDGDFANENMQSIIDKGTSHLNKKDLEAIAVYLLNNKKIKSATVQ